MPKKRARAAEVYERLAWVRPPIRPNRVDGGCWLGTQRRGKQTRPTCARDGRSCGDVRRRAYGRGWGDTAGPSSRVSRDPEVAAANLAAQLLLAAVSLPGRASFDRRRAVRVRRDRRQLVQLPVRLVPEAAAAAQPALANRGVSPGQPRRVLVLPSAPARAGDPRLPRSGRQLPRHPQRLLSDPTVQPPVTEEQRSGDCRHLARAAVYPRRSKRELATSAMTMKSRLPRRPQFRYVAIPWQSQHS